MMRYFSLCCFFVCMAVLPSGTFGQNILKITLDAAQLQNPDCWLNNGVVAQNKVYLHSGLCVSNPSFCNDSIAGFGSPVWEHLTGNWAMDDGVGEMTFTGSTTWEFQLDLDSYHPAPTGSTPYTMGFVFRDLDGTFEGKDNQCGDMFVTDLNTSTPQVIQGSTRAPMPGVTATKVTVGVEEASFFTNLILFPNPSTGTVNLTYDLEQGYDQMELTVVNMMGQELIVRELGKQSLGSQELQWEMDAAGIYQALLRSGDQVLAVRKFSIQ